MAILSNLLSPSFLRLPKTQLAAIAVIIIGTLDSLSAADISAPTTTGASAASPNDNTAPPYKGVYRWGQGGCVKGQYDSYNKWLNRESTWPQDFMPTDSWDALEGQDWQLGTWGPYVHKVAGRKLVLSVPMLAGGWSGKGPVKGQAANVPVSLEEGAKGTYNIYYQHLAENLVKRGLSDTLLRLGWEFNGGWYTWRAQKEDQAKAYAAYFHQIVTTMRAVPGAENLKFIWNPAMEPWWPYSPESAYPGDDVVDYIGIDVYDQSWVKDTYPAPDGASDQDILDRQKLAWSQKTNNEKAMGLPYWVKFARTHNKPLTIPEWGVCIRKDKHGGGDDPYFIEQMHDFIADPGNNVYYESYFDVGAPDGDHRLAPDLDSKNPGAMKESNLPLSSAKFKEYYALTDGEKSQEAPASSPDTNTAPVVPAKTP